MAKRLSTRRQLSAVFLALAFCAGVGAGTIEAKTSIEPSIRPLAFGEFADEQIDGMLSRHEAPGAAIVMVEDGTIAFSRGYGVADLKSRAPIDPETSAFRVGSVSKLFPTVAILQLVERGKLSLGDEIQPYLPDVQLGADGAGVKIRNLLTHTDGFDVGWAVGGAVRDERDAVSLATFLQTHRPRRILPPGQMYVYSDVGMALAGHIVEKVSERGFAQYAHDEIFAPLAMDHSTFEQVLPTEVALHLATGYRRFHGEFIPMPTEHVLAIPSAGMTTTPHDMARFMIACLGDGSIDGARVLAPATMMLMRTRQFTHHPALPGTAFGFHEHLQNGQTVYMHSGVMPGYHATMILVPAQKTGIFLVTNGFADETFEPFVNALFDRFFPKPTTQPISPAPASQPPPSDAAGRYRYVQYPHETIGKLSILAGLVEERRVRLGPDETIIVDQGLKGPFRFAAPLLYVRGEEAMAFRQDENGRTVGLAYDTWAFEKIHWYEARHAQMAMIALMVIVFVFASAARATRRIVFRKSAAPQSARDLAAIACAVNLAGLLILSAYVWRTDVFQWYYGLPGPLVAMTYLPWLGSALTILSVVLTIRQARSRDWRVLSKCAHGLVLVALLIFPIFCWYWNLLA